jgi:hypothetical protein
MKDSPKVGPVLLDFFPEAFSSFLSSLALSSYLHLSRSKVALQTVVRIPENAIANQSSTYQQRLSPS